MKKSLLQAGLAAAMLVFAGTPHAQAVSEPIFIGGDELSTPSYAVASGACRLVNLSPEPRPFRCAVEATSGASASLAGLQRGDLHLALVPADQFHHAVNGTGPYAAAGPDRELRAVAALHVRALAVVTRRDANIRTAADLLGKRVNLGRTGSSTRAEIDSILSSAKIGPDAFLHVADIGAEDQGAALCDGRFDAFVFAAGVPAPQVLYPAAACGARLAPFDGPLAQTLVAERPYFRFVTIRGGTYPNNPQDVRTLGVPTVLVAMRTTPPATVRAVLGAITADLERFRHLHPALATLTPGSMASDGLIAPLHEAAEAAYRDRGWIR